MNLRWWSGKRVFLTGHTGFKGSWCALWLVRLGADVRGYALAPPTQPNLFDQLGLAREMTSVVADIRDRERLTRELRESRADAVLHLAAQSLVRVGYARPADTYDVNVVGTANVIEAVRQTPSVKTAVIVTSDKCYQLTDEAARYAESAPLGGRDPYSASKAGAEVVAGALRSAFFGSDPSRAAIATARAGNVIGGGDRATDRLVPDLVTAFEAHRAARVRNPDHVRPWQHVLDPVAGYLEVARQLEGSRDLARAWNFGPPASNEWPVRALADGLAQRFGGDARWETAPSSDDAYEAPALRLDSSAALTHLGWRARIDLDRALDWVAQWHTGVAAGESARALSLAQIGRYESLAGASAVVSDAATS